MKFNLPEDVLPEDDFVPVEVGNVYPSKNSRKTKYWLVIAVEGNMAHCLGLNADGFISSTASYGKHVFEGASSVFKQRRVLGRVEGLDQLDFDIVWKPEE